MKKRVLLGSVLLAAVSAFSQTSQRTRPTGMINAKIIADSKFVTEGSATATKSSPIKPLSLPVRSGSKTNAVTWQNLSSSMNIYGMVISYAKPLQWNDELNAVSFVHRKSPSYVISPLPASTAATGGIMAHFSTNCGVSWDSTALYSNDNFWGRYPGGGIYNPPSTPANTDINNAYIVGAGPTTGASATTWIGNFYASKKLGGANNNNAPSTAPGAQQAMPTGAPFSPGVPSRHDFSAYGFTATDDGKMRVMAGITDDAVAADSAIMLMTGTFNSGTSTFDWAGRVFNPPTTIASDGSDNFTSRPIMAWNEQGTIGYVVILGSRLGATKSNVGLQPIVYKTTNSGSTWSLENGINFNSAAYNNVKTRLRATSVGGDTIPNFLWLEGVDASVDANNKLHIFTSLVGHSSGDPDSLNFISQWGTETYLWPHANIETNGLPIHPFLWDFVYDGTNVSPSWAHMLIDSMSTEGPGSRTTDGGYQDNPWDMDPSASNQKVRLDARLQMSRTPDGKHLLYSWTESDTAFTDNQKKWNNLPNIKARLYDVDNAVLSSTELDLTSNANGEVANRAMYQFVSPKMKLVSKTPTSINVDVAMTVSNSNPYSQLTVNNHWYSCAGMSFARPNSVGLAENKSNSLNNSSIYPNPAKANVTVKVSLAVGSKVQIEVMNTVGQVVKATVVQGQAGINTINVDLSGLAIGIYLVNIKADNATSTKKLVIE